MTVSAPWLCDGFMHALTAVIKKGRRVVIIESMAQVHMTEAELARDLHEALLKAQQGVEGVVEQDHRPVAVIRSPVPKGRLLSECIALAEARGSTATLDEGLIKDVEEGIASRSQPWKPPTWE